MPTEAISITGVRSRPLPTKVTACPRATSERTSAAFSMGLSAAERADMILFVVDGSEGVPGEAAEELERMRGRKVLCVLNKKDLGLALDDEEAASRLGAERAISVSALNGEGLDCLREWLYAESITRSSVETGRERLALNARQAEALRRADDALGKLERAMGEGAPAELLRRKGSKFETRSYTWPMSTNKTPPATL